MTTFLEGYERQREDLDDILLRALQPDPLPWKDVVSKTGITLIQTPDGNSTHDCHWYVFQNEAWYQIPDQRNMFLINPIGFLLQHGYTEVQAPKPGDVVSYFGDDDPLHVKHSGKIASSNKILSKLGKYGPVVEHELELVPYAYGDYVLFFRKVQNNPK